MLKLKDKHEHKLKYQVDECKLFKTPPTNVTTNFIIYLSDHTFSEAQTWILHKLLKFVLSNEGCLMFDFITAVESGIQMLPEQERNDLRCCVKTVPDKQYVYKVIVEKKLII